MVETMTAVQLAVRAQGLIDAMNEIESMRQAREDIRTIARLFNLDAEQLWKDGIEEWYRVARKAYCN